MRIKVHYPYAALTVLTALFSCLKAEVPTDTSVASGKQQVGFDILVTREGEAIPAERQANMTKSSAVYDSGETPTTMNPDTPFGLVGIDYDHHALVVDNAKVQSGTEGYNAILDSGYWENIRTSTISFSAYYPYVNHVDYDDNLVSYSIPYSVEETSAGPLVSKTVEMAVNMLNIMPLEFQHITNDIGYRICDVTPDENLQGLIHLRKLTAHNVASAGIFVNDVALSQGIWHRQGYYRNVVVFEGDAKVGVGPQNELFVGYNTLEERMVNSHRFYSIPDEILLGKQYVEAVFDVEGFYIENFYYPPIEEQVAIFPLYGLLPDNVFVYGRQYTFHIGIDLRSVYSAITFTASVADWETKIYENNDEF